MGAVSSLAVTARLGSARLTTCTSGTVGSAPPTWSTWPWSAPSTTISSTRTNGCSSGSNVALMLNCLAAAGGPRRRTVAPSCVSEDGPPDHRGQVVAEVPTSLQRQLGAVTRLAGSEEPALRLLDSYVVDAGLAATHQPFGIELPLLVAVGPVPLTGGIV